MSEPPYRVGIVGLRAGSWAAVAHVPALRGLPEDYEIAGVANTSVVSAEAAAREHGVPHAFADAEALVASRDIDIVVVTTKVPDHHELVVAAIRAGKHVYCEWPLGLTVDQAQDMADLARQHDVLAVAGTQGRLAPEIELLRDLVAEGHVGQVLSSTVVGTASKIWGATVTPRRAYALDRANGMTLVTVMLGHTLAAIGEVLGPIAELSAILATRRRTVRVASVDEAQDRAAQQVVRATAPDQVLVTARFASDAPFSLHYRSGTPRGLPLLWEINGTDGDLRLTGANGNVQAVPLAVQGARGDDAQLQALEIPARYRAHAEDGPIVGNVRRVYAAMAADLRTGSRRAPTFDDAVDTHRVIAAIEEADRSGGRVRPASAALVT